MECNVCESVRVVVVFQALGAQPLLQSEISQQLDVGLRNLPPALLLLHHLLKTAQDTQAQLLQRLDICSADTGTKAHGTPPSGRRGERPHAQSNQKGGVWWTGLETTTNSPAAGRLLCCNENRSTGGNLKTGGKPPRLTFKQVPVLGEAMSIEPFLDLTFFAFFPAYFPEKDPRGRAKQEGQHKAAVHQTIFSLHRVPSPKAPAYSMKGCTETQTGVIIGTSSSNQ